MSKPKNVTLMVVPEGAEQRFGFRMPYWLLKVIAGAFGLLILGIILFFIFYGKVLSMAFQADNLKKENERLMKYHYKVQLLEHNLTEARNIVERLTELAGIDIEFPEMPSDSELFANLDQPKAVVPRNQTGDWSVPSGLPIQGFISQDFDVVDSGKYHPGVDIPCAVGTPVLATAAGRVSEIKEDSTYGKMIIIDHSDSVQTVYAHNSEILVNVGQAVMAGSRIALSGNTGISSAPHLHYEIRVNNKPIDPMEKKL